MMTIIVSVIVMLNLQSATFELLLMYVASIAAAGGLNPRTNTVS